MNHFKCSFSFHDKEPPAAWSQDSRIKILSQSLSCVKHINCISEFISSFSCGSSRVMFKHYGICARICPFISFSLLLPCGKNNKRKPPRIYPQGFCREAGIYLFSQAVSSQLSSAQVSLTSVFGMGTGGTSPSSTPAVQIWIWTISLFSFGRTCLQNWIIICVCNQSTSAFNLVKPSIY